MTEFSAIRILQPLGEFYIAAIPANFLLKVCFSHRYSRLYADNSGRVEDKGHQRRLDQTRLEEISNYLQTQEAVLPGTIIIAANCTPEGQILDPVVEEELNARRWNVISSGNDDREVVKIRIPTDEKLAAIVDGQHRLYGFVDLPDELRKMSLPCAIFLDLPTPQQATIFSTINFNQRPVNKSQTYELFGYNLDDEPEKSWSPDKLAVFFARKLNADENSPFRDHIKVAAQDDRILDKISIERQNEWSVSTATIVEGILLLISKNPKEDRDILHRDPVDVRTRKTLRDIPLTGLKPPFRDLYLSIDRDILIYKTLVNYFSAVKLVFWADLKTDNKSLIRKTAGIQALFHVFKELLPKQLSELDLQESTWTAILEKARILDFSNSVFESSGKGRKRIQDAILVAIGAKNSEKILDTHLREYLHVLHKE